MVLQQSSVGNPYFDIEQMIVMHITCQCRDFPTELCCNTIIHLLFHYVLLLESYFIFKINKI